MNGAIPPLPQYGFIVWCLLKHRDNFTFTFTWSTSSSGPQLKENLDIKFPLEAKLKMSLQ